MWRSFLLATLLTGTLAAAPADEPDVLVGTIFERVKIELDRELPDPTHRPSHVLRRDGRIAETTVDLPPAPADQRDARRIVATLGVEPSLVRTEHGYRPGDPWPRIGSVSVLDDDREVEIMRFITPFGGATTYRADLTALAPLLHGQRTMRVFISTYAKPGWEVTLSLAYSDSDAGQRRPAFAASVFNEEQVTSEENILRSAVTIPEGLDRPRIRILSTGHATDGAGGDEFITRTHVLRVGGDEVARWRPWAERGATVRALNPASGRLTIDGRDLWSSDLDRAGWNPGAIVWPLIIPLPELSPGEHEIELEIQDIRPAGEDGHHGYWRVSAIVVADEPWPDAPESQ